eukprot:755205-Hanusia_phi.AAC.4
MPCLRFLDDDADRCPDPKEKLHYLGHLRVAFTSRFYRTRFHFLLSLLPHQCSSCSGFFLFCPSPFFLLCMHDGFLQGVNQKTIRTFFAAPASVKLTCCLLFELSLRERCVHEKRREDETAKGRERRLGNRRVREGELQVDKDENGKGREEEGGEGEERKWRMGEEKKGGEVMERRWERIKRSVS